MNPEAQELFNTIINKAPSALTTGDLEFLRARSSYVSAEVMERLGLDFKTKKVVTPKVEDIKEDLIVDDNKKVDETVKLPDPEDTTKNETIDNPLASDKPILESLSYAELKDKAKSLGLKYTAVSTKNLIKSITAKLAEATGN